MFALHYAIGFMQTMLFGLKPKKSPKGGGSMLFDQSLKLQATTLHGQLVHVKNVGALLHQYICEPSATRRTNVDTDESELGSKLVLPEQSLSSTLSFHQTVLGLGATRLSPPPPDLLSLLYQFFLNISFLEAVSDAM